MSKAKIVKDIVKKNVGEPSTFGTDPRDPWSTKSNLKEWAGNPKGLLGKYLKSRGINPKFATKDQKIAHSKTGKFQKWQRDHSERSSPTGTTVHEEVDKKDTITFDIPLLIRVLEFAREDLKSDINLHKMVERLLAIRGKGTLTMNQYGNIVKESFEDLNEEQLDEISKELANSYMWQAKSDRDKIDNRRMKLHDKNSQQMRYQGSISLRRHKNITKLLAKSGKRTDGINRALDRLAKEETELDESWKYHTYPSNEVARAAVKAHHSYRDENGMASGNPARAMGNGKVAYKGEFKGPKPTKSVSEAKEANYGGDYQASVLRFKEKAAKKPVDMKSLAARMQAAYAKEDEKKKTVANESALPRNLVWDGERVKKDPAVVAGNKRKKNYQSYLRRKAAKEKAQEPVKENMEPLAACACSGDGANTPDDVAPKDKNKKLIQMSKSARIIKSIYKNKGMKESVNEELYDHEKEDKSTAPMGKKPKMQKLGADAETLQAPQAAAVLTGGKTMTGEPRDTIEIDPMMKMRKQSGNSQKNV